MTIAPRNWRLAKPLAWNLVAAGVGQGATLVLTMVLANILGPTLFGRFSITTGTILALSALAQAGLAFTATNFVARYMTTDRPHAERIASFCVFAASVTGLLLGAGLMLGSLAVAVYLYGDASLFPLFMLAGVGIPAATLGLVQNAILIGLQAFRPLALNAIVYAVAVLAAALAGYLLAGPMGAAIGYVVAVYIRVFHGAFLLKRVFAPLPPWRRPDRGRRLLGQLAPFALPTALSGLTATPAVWLSNAWLVNAQGLHELGLFSTAFMVKTLVVFVPIQIGTVFLPRYIAAGETDPAGANLYLLRVMLAVFAFSASVAGTIVLLAPWLMTIFGAQFVPGASALRWLMATVVAESVATILSYRLAGERRMWTSLLAYTLPKDIILMTAAALLAPRYGAAGLAGAHLLSWLYGLTAVLAFALRPAPHPSPEAAGEPGDDPERLARTDNSGS